MDTALEDLMLTDAAPPASALRKALAASADNARKVGVVSAPKAAPMDAYFRSLRQHYVAEHGEPQRLRRTEQKQRRDAGVPRTDANLTAQRERLGAPLPDTTFRKRPAAAVTEAVAASPQKRARLREEHVLGGVAARVGAETVVASEAAQAKIAKRLAAAARPAAPKPPKIRKAFVSRDTGGNKEAEHSAPAGVALTTTGKLEPRLRRLNFRVANDPVEFARLVSRVRARAPTCGHLALVPNGVRTDFSLSARLAAALLGAYKVTPTDYDSRGLACSGCEFKPFYTTFSDIMKVVVSATIGERFPTVPALLRRVASCPGSKLAFYEERELQKQFKKASKKKGNRLEEPSSHVHRGRMERGPKRER